MSPDTGWCEGCQRTIDEITRWSRTTDDDRRGILAAKTAEQAMPRLATKTHQLAYRQLIGGRRMLR